MRVAPHAGAWIETRLGRGRGSLSAVAPHAGAWIETVRYRNSHLGPRVAPHAGAWIETDHVHRSPAGGKSPLTQGRGLKRNFTRLFFPTVSRRPSRRGVD